jgi:hypothetical protein
MRQSSESGIGNFHHSGGVMRQVPELLCVACLSVTFLFPDGARAAAKVTILPDKDFTITKTVGDLKYVETVSGFVQAYVKNRSGNMVMQVDGDITGFAFGAGATTFKGDEYIYDITLSTLGDGDGLCKYFIKVDDWVSDTFTQTTYSESIQQKTWKNVTVRSNSRIIVAFNGSDSKMHGPGEGPRGYHMAHGRWTQLDMNPVKPTAVIGATSRPVRSPANRSIAAGVYDCAGRLIRPAARLCHEPGSAAFLIVREIH